MRWFWRALCAAAVTELLVYTITPPRYIHEQFEVNRAWIIGQIARVLVITFAAVTIADIVLTRSMPRLRAMRRSALVAFVAGLLAAAVGLSWWFSAFALVIAPVGIAAGVMTLRTENANRERHDRLNVMGLALSVLSPSVFIFQIAIMLILDHRK